MPEPHIKRGSGQLTIDLQGPFKLNARLIEGGIPFVAVDFWPDVSVFITDEDTADKIIAVIARAKAMLPKKAVKDA